jgi:hypothetical protein
MVSLSHCLYGRLTAPYIGYLKDSSARCQSNYSSLGSRAKRRVLFDSPERSLARPTCAAGRPLRTRRLRTVADALERRQGAIQAVLSPVQRGRTGCACRGGGNRAWTGFEVAKDGMGEGQLVRGRQGARDMTNDPCQRGPDQSEGERHLSSSFGSLQYGIYRALSIPNGSKVGLPPIPLIGPCHSFWAPFATHPACSDLNLPPLLSLDPMASPFNSECVHQRDYWGRSLKAPKMEVQAAVYLPAYKRPSLSLSLSRPSAHRLPFQLYLSSQCQSSSVGRRRSTIWALSTSILPKDCVPLL